MRVVRQLLGPDATRVQRVFLYSGAPPAAGATEASAEDLHVVSIAGAQGSAAPALRRRSASRMAALRLCSILLRCVVRCLSSHDNSRHCFIPVGACWLVSGIRAAHNAAAVAR